MKKIEVIAAVNAINKIPVSKVTDKEVRYALIDDYLLLRKTAREIDAERSELIDKFREEWPAEVATPQIQSGRVSAELEAAQVRLDEDLTRLSNASIEVNGLKAIERSAFCSALGDDVDITFDDIAALDGIVIQ